MSLKVTIVTQDEPFYLPVFFETLLDNLHEEVVVERIVVLDTLDESTFSLAKRMFQFYGPANFARRSFQYGVRKISDAVGFDTHSVCRLAQERGIPIQRRETINDDEFTAEVGADTDVVLSVAASEIFGSQLLEAPSWGCVNVHTSDLPKYRGLLPTFWALYHGEDEVGVTVHTMVEEIDQGEVLAKTTFDVDRSMTLDDVILQGKRTGAKLVAETLEAIQTGRVDSEPMTEDGSYHSFPTRSERRELQERGWSLL